MMTDAIVAKRLDADIANLSLDSPMQQRSQVGDLSERSLTTPTGWWWLTGVPEATIKDKIADGYRIIDLEIESTSPYRFSAAFVKNTGAHQKGWWWYYGKTSEQIKELISKHKARIIDLEIYFVNGQKRYAVVMVANAGTDAKTWWYYSQLSFQALGDKLKQNEARLIDLGTYVHSGQRYFSAVMIPNKGTDYKDWWYYSGLTAQEVSQKLKQNQARLTDIEIRSRSLSGNTYTVIMEKTKRESWWWYLGRTMEQVNQLTAQNGARIIDIEPYTEGNTKRFNVIMLNNSNALTTRIRRLLKSNRKKGAYGLYLKRVNGKILASLQRDRIFEPASTIKVLHHLHAMLQVRDGDSQLDSAIPWFKDSTNDEKPGAGCPLNQQPATDRLDVGLKAMMENSDNRWTEAIRVFFGERKINTTAQQLGMTDTKLQHRIGCGSGADGAIQEPNRLTLTDIGRLYEAVAEGLLGTDALRETFYRLMSDSLGDIAAVIDEEANRLNLSASVVQSFKQQVRTAAKAGSYTLSGKRYLTIGGWARLPVKQNSSIGQREYVFGLFIDAADDIDDDFSIWAARGELLRDSIRSALASFG